MAQTFQKRTEALGELRGELDAKLGDEFNVYLDRSTTIGFDPKTSGPQSESYGYFTKLSYDPETDTLDFELWISLVPPSSRDESRSRGSLEIMTSLEATKAYARTTFPERLTAAEEHLKTEGAGFELINSYTSDEGPDLIVEFRKEGVTLDELPEVLRTVAKGPFYVQPNQG